MKPTPLTNIPLRLEKDRLRLESAVPPDGDDHRRFMEMAAEAESLARPKAIYLEARVEQAAGAEVRIEGVLFHSSVLAKNLDQAGQVYPYAATCGRELEDWAAGLADPLEQYWAEVFMLEALATATSCLEKRLHGLTPATLGTMNPGSLPDWPLPEQRPLFALLGDTEALIGLALTESCLMLPRKSTSGIMFPSAVGYSNCQLCAREGCPRRRAPHDARLSREKYRLGCAEE